MEKKVTFPELVELLAIKRDCTKREAENFLRELIALMTEVVSSGEVLRINGLGVFKPVWVEERASVNVQTGEPSVIPGHYKLTFTPAKAVREAVNEPFACFCVEELPDDAPILSDGSKIDEVDADSADMRFAAVSAYENLRNARVIEGFFQNVIIVQCAAAEVDDPAQAGTLTLDKIVDNFSGASGGGRSKHYGRNAGLRCTVDNTLKIFQGYRTFGLERKLFRQDDSDNRKTPLKLFAGTFGDRQ